MSITRLFQWSVVESLWLHAHSNKKRATKGFFTNCYSTKVMNKYTILSCRLHKIFNPKRTYEIHLEKRKHTL